MTASLIEAARKLCAESEEYEFADGVMLAAPIDVWHTLMDAIEAAESSQREFANPGDIESRIIPLYAGKPEGPR